MKKRTPEFLIKIARKIFKEHKFANENEEFLRAKFLTINIIKYYEKGKELSDKQVNVLENFIIAINTELFNTRLKEIMEEDKKDKTEEFLKEY